MSDLVRFGDWRTVLADVATCSAIITDPPYGARTHASAPTRSDGVDAAGLAPTYAPWVPDDVAHFFDWWGTRCKGWIACMTDDSLIPHFREHAARVGRLDFAPVPCVMTGMTVRTRGDGPSSWACYLMVSRPRGGGWEDWGTLPGAYTGPRGQEAGGGRGKPDWLMRAIVRDYSKPRDLVVDPFSGWAATGMAALGLDRQYLGAESDPEAIKEGNARLGRGQQRDMFAGVS